MYFLEEIEECNVWIQLRLICESRKIACYIYWSQDKKLQ